MEFACAHDLVMIDLQEHGIRFTAKRYAAEMQIVLRKLCLELS